MTILGNEKNLFGANLEDHTRMRRVLSRGISMKAMLDQQPLISTHVNLLLQRLHEHCEGGARPVDMVSWYNRVTFDVISDLSWGEALEFLEKSQDPLDKSTGTHSQVSKVSWARQKILTLYPHSESSDPEGVDSTRKR